MKSHRRRTRPRREFLALALKIKPNFSSEAMDQFIDAMNGLNTPGTSFQDQFRILERNQRANARRDRYNRKRRFRKLWRAQVFLRLNHRGLANFGMLLRVGGLAWTPRESKAVISGLYGLDLRFSRKLAFECEVIKELFSTTRDPAQVDSIPDTGENASDRWKGREEFLSLLVPTPVPAPPCPNTVSIDNELGKIDVKELPMQEAAAIAACA
jgi:hypothetical protein